MNRVLFARMSVWRFKKNQRDKGLKKIDERAPKVRSAKGYRGYLRLISDEAPDCVTMITLWESEKTMKDSLEGIFKDSINSMKEYLADQPSVSRFKVPVGEVQF